MIDPSDGTPFASIARGGAADIDDAVARRARARDGAWGKLAPAERGRCLARLGAPSATTPTSSRYSKRAIAASR